MTAALLSLLLACGAGNDAPSVPVAPMALDGQDCAVCGMTVDEQPAPRAQVRFHNGVHELYCSIGDLQVASAAPSRHGKVDNTWVEALPADFDPASTRTPPLPWIPAGDAHVVVGVPRPLVMGAPALTYATAAAATAAAQAHGGRAYSWSQFAALPPGENP